MVDVTNEHKRAFGKPPAPAVQAHTRVMGVERDRLQKFQLLLVGGKGSAVAAICMECDSACLTHHPHAGSPRPPLA